MCNLLAVDRGGDLNPECYVWLLRWFFVYISPIFIGLHGSASLLRIELRDEVMTVTHPPVDPMIEEIVQAIVNAAAPERIILFGSAARGMLGPDSDIDLLVVERESSFHKGSRRAESSRIRKALWKFPVPIDVLIFTPEEIDRWKDSTNHVIARSSREGRVVYDRP